MKEGYSALELKQKNRNSIYRLLYDCGCIPKQRIVAELGLSLPTVNQNLDSFIKEGLIKKNGSFGNTGGRRAIGYEIVNDAKVAVGVDLNKNHFSIVVVDLKGNILSSIKQYQKFANNEDYYEMIGDSVENVLQKADVMDERILGVGIAVQGIISNKSDYVSYGEILNITGETKESIGKYIKYPKSLYHDSDAAAFAEYCYNKKESERVYLSLSTNLGGAIIGPDNFNYKGKYGRARVEHMTIEPYGKRCYCGQYGCADAYCSTHVLTDTVEDEQLETFFCKLKQGDRDTKAVWNQYMEKLSVVINNVCMMYDCNIVLGGYLGEYLDDYFEELKKITYNRNSFDCTRDYLCKSHVKIEPVAIGAAFKYIERFISEI